MSLVIAYNAPDCQIWCSDGLTFSLQGVRVSQACATAKKITPIPNNQIACGWSGEKNDAEFIINNLSLRHPVSLADFLGGVSDKCHKVNCFSRDCCEQRDQVYCPTGLMVGGYLPGKRFLAVVSPEGQIHRYKKFGAIGIGADKATTRLTTLSLKQASTTQIFDALIEILQNAFCESEYVGGAAYWLFLTSEDCIELVWPNIENRQLHSQGREALRRIVLQCARP